LLPLCIQDWADQEVEQALRWSLKSKGVSSPGKLDHMATGLMVLCLGHASKLSNLFHEQTSTYTAVVRLGEATDTYDASGQITETLGWEHVTGEDPPRIPGCRVPAAV
jgi:tRNA pseudouridine55 synthase